MIDACNISFDEDKPKYWEKVFGTEVVVPAKNLLVTKALLRLLPGVVWWAGSPVCKMKTALGLHLV